MDSGCFSKFFDTKFSQNGQLEGHQRKGFRFCTKTEAEKKSRLEVEEGMSKHDVIGSVWMARSSARLYGWISVRLGSAPVFHMVPVHEVLGRFFIFWVISSIFLAGFKRFFDWFKVFGPGLNF